MLSLPLGPIALPLAPVLLLIAIRGSSWLASRLARQGADKVPGEQAGRTVTHAGLLGLVAARLAYLVWHADAYLASPWATFDLRDGGWSASAGLVAGVAWLAWRGLVTPWLRRPLAVSGAAGVAFWWLATLASGLAGTHSLPPVQLVRIEDARVLDLTEAARGRPVVVNLWASWCGPCRAEMPTLAAAQQREPTVAFLFVNQGESPATVQSFLQKQSFTLRDVMLDSGSSLGQAIASRGLPITLFFDAKGRQVDAHFGILNPAALESRLRQLRTAPR